MSFISTLFHRIQNTLEIIPDVYQLTIRGSNTILVVEEELTLIDAGLRGSAPQIMNFIQNLGRSPEEISLIIFTHNHVDHVGGLAELKQWTSGKVAIHKSDIGGRKILPSIEAEDVDIHLDGGEAFKPLGGLNVIHTPGHTPGSISIFSPEKQLLVAGDALRKRRKILHLPPKLLISDLADAIESLKKIAQLDFDILCFGHGLPMAEDVKIRIQDLIDRNKD